MKQRSPEWFAIRVGKITGSRVGAILGVNPYKTQDDVLREMVREACDAPREFNGNIRTQWGEDHESTAINWFEETYGYLVEEIGFVVHPDPDFYYLGYSPDGVIGRGRSRNLIEVKCPYSRKIPKEIPEYYLAQVQHGMAVMDIRETRFIYWTPETSKVFEVKQDKNWLGRNMPALREFHEVYVAALENPDVHLESSSVERTDTQFKEKVEAYLRAKRQSEKATEALSYAKEELVEAAEGKDTVGFGLRVTHVTSKGRPDYSGFFKNHPELKDEVETGPTSSSVRITLEKSDAKSLRYSR